MQVTSYCVAHFVEQVHNDCGFDLKRLKGFFLSFFFQLYLKLKRTSPK